ncbi:MAG: hypothetical protein NZ480_07425 [Bdellovibrionaceae bacterium]|nr:hypothetical protein [Pseudobdellovibrionaceae bacterium]MDW8190871.1 hypothetical protein [Pseudobdellovibrionaceae bacterium]
MKWAIAFALVIFNSFMLYGQDSKRVKSSSATKSSSSSPSKSSSTQSMSTQSMSYYDFSMSEKLFKITFGLQGTGINFGAEYEQRTSDRRFTVYGLIGLENTDANKPQLLLFGTGIPLYVLETEKDTISINPGVGLATIKIGSGSTEFTAGLQLKIAVTHQFAPKVHLGIDHLIFTNWINSKIASQDWSVTQLTYCFHF